MAFGRLDIFWPDGRFNSHTLNTPTVSVGRASGNTISLDTETVSRYHFSLTYEDGVVSITDLDSEKGTFIDGIKLDSNQRQILQGVEEIIIGQLRIIYHPLDDSPTIPMSASNEEEDTQRVDREDAQFSVNIDVSSLDVWPAASTSTELSITNMSNTVRFFSVRMSGLPDGWVRVNRAQIEIDPGETTHVLINVKPPRRPDTRPAAYQATLQIIPRDKPDAMIVLPLAVTIHAYNGFGMALAAERLEPGEPARLFLHNQGSAPLPLRVTGSDPAQRLQFSLPGTPFTLAPGQRMQINAKIQARKPALTGKSEELSFDIIVQSLDAVAFTAAVQGQATIAPRLPIWGALTALGIFASFVVLVLLLLVSVLSLPVPRILDMSLNQSQVAQGEALILSWQVSDAERYEVLVNGISVQTLDAAAREAIIDTTELVGALDIDLRAENRSGEASASTSAQIYRPMILENFTVTPNQLVRNVVTTLEISWNVPGALRTQLQGLEAFTNAPLPNSFGESGLLEGIGGVPSSALTLLLIAEDEVGNLLEERREIPLIDPTCGTTRDIQLREGPDPLYQTVGSVPAQTSVIVDAQDASGTWLRVLLVGGVFGWSPLDAFVCSPTFTTDDLRTELNVPPLPTITPTPTQTPISSPTIPVLPSPSPASSETPIGP